MPSIFGVMYRIQNYSATFAFIYSFSGTEAAMVWAACAFVTFQDFICRNYVCKTVLFAPITLAVWCPLAPRCCTLHTAQQSWCLQWSLGRGKGRGINKGRPRMVISRVSQLHVPYTTDPDLDQYMNYFRRISGTMGPAYAPDNLHVSVCI